MAGNGSLDFTHETRLKSASQMPLNLYRRHQSACKGGHPEDSRSGEFQERSKTWKRCGCSIFVAGSLNKTFKRRNTGRFDWDGGREVASRYEAAGCWDDVPAPAPVPEPTPQPAETNVVTFERASKAYLAEHEKHSSHNTAKRYGFIIAKLQRWNDHKGYTSLAQWTPIDVRECRDNWAVSQRTANKDMSVVKAFFEFCIDNEWMEKSPAARVKNPRGKASSDGRHEQKLPFTDAELQRMYDAAETKYGKMEIKWDRDAHAKPAEGVVNSWRYSWTGKDLADFISVSVYTGLRISDVATFHANRMKPNGEITIRTTKSGASVNTWVPPWLQEIIRRRSLEVGPRIFGEHETKDLNVVTDIWRRKLKRLWRLCGEWKDKPTPHRFRHTFARILLERPGIGPKEVAELLGNSEAMVIKHYAAWIPSRQERLTELLKGAFAETPRPDNVVEMVPKSGTK